MSEPTAPALLGPEAANRLAEFSRVCKAAARAVSLYPGGHPAIGVSLTRLEQATVRMTAGGPYTLQVQSDALMIDGARIAKPDPAVSELAALLHKHLIGKLTLNAGANAESWRTLLLLLARAPEEVRADGGIAKLWLTAGGPSLEVTEVDYIEVLREKQGLAATIHSIIDAAMSGPTLTVDDAAMRAVLDIVGDQSKLRELMTQLEQTAAKSPKGVELQTAALLNIVRGLVDYVSRNEPQQLNEVFEQFGRGARHLSVEAMIALLAERKRPEAMAGSVNVVSALIESMNDQSVAGFVADSVVAERGASERLAHAFRSLVPEFDRQRQLLALAREEVAGSAMAKEQDAEEFKGLWNGVEQMLTSYTDARYVSEEYARELSHARTLPMDVERISDDPPERIADWLSTVSDGALRTLDQDLLTDLLRIETDASRWRDVADTVVTHADDLVRVGHFDQAWGLIEVIIAEGEPSPFRRPHAASALDRFARGSLMKHVSPHLRGAGEAEYERFKRLCHTIGPSIVAPLAEVLAAEQDARARRRLRDILVGFGPRGAESVRPLLNAGNWEVRRTAAFLLREFGGVEGLKELVPLLADAEPLVQREAVQGLMMNGSKEAAVILLNALTTAKGQTRETLMNEILKMRDVRSAPLYSHLVRHMDRYTFPDLYVASIEALGSFSSADAVESLKVVLHTGSWLRPFASRRYRAAAAHALARIGSPDAIAVLRDASANGGLGVRSAARAELARTAS
jgi:HEAT repeats/PBS lyase HEAT-like repeat